MLLAFGWALFVGPAIWLATLMAQHWLLLLALTIAYRASVTLLVCLLPEGNWWRERQLRAPQAHQLVLITGASSGIGLALAKHLYKLGYSVAAAHLPGTSEPGLIELQRLADSAGANPSGARLFLVAMDVCDEQSIGSAYAQVESLLAKERLVLYALVNNAGLGSLQPFAWLQRKTIRRLIETNLLGSLLVTREFLPLLASNKRHASNGQISSPNNKRLVFVSSGLGFVPGATYTTYGITKAAQIYLSKCLNLELKQDYGVQAVAVIPHNFIKNTSICAANVRNNQAALEELKGVERQLYANEMKQHFELVRSLEEATRERARKAAAATDAPTNSTLPASGRTSDRATKRALARDQNAGSQGLGALVSVASKFLAALKLISASLAGENTALTLEESGAMQGFELALRLQDPPEILFAGDTAFQLVVGSLLLLLPNSMSGLLSNSVAPSLYR